MRSNLVIDSDSERAIEFIKKLNHPREMKKYVEYENESIIFYEDKKFFITNQASDILGALSLHSVYVHGEIKLTQEEEEMLRDSLIKVHGIDGVDRELSRIYRY